MKISPCRRFGVSSAMLLALALPRAAAAQIVTERGFVEGTLLGFAQQAPNDPAGLVGDLLAREEVFIKPAGWAQFAAGFELRANSDEEVEDRWRLDWSDRSVRRPRLSVRRLSATFTRGALTLDLGKQFVRWGKTDIVTPTDRFAPRDFVNVVDTEFLPVIGTRGVVEIGRETVDVVWVPRFTPSRMPLLDQRWTVVPAGTGRVRLADGGALPSGPDAGIRWSHVASRFEGALSFFDGFNHVPTIDVQLSAPSGVRPPTFSVDVTRTYSRIRVVGADVAVPTAFFTVKGEAAYVTASSPSTDEYVLYVVQLERQHGEWVLIVGYAGDVVTARRAGLTFEPERGLARAFVGRASYTLDSNRGLAFEAAARQSGRGLYAKGEYSQAYRQNWRATVTAVAIAGHGDDFLGQYHHNSHLTLRLRYSF